MNEELEFLKWFNSLSQLEHAAFGMTVRERCSKINNNGVEPHALIEIMRQTWKESQ